ncbi:MAG: hypothetical protein ACE5GF_04085, partial [Thermodesulfobacteriota bacterium]
GALVLGGGLSFAWRQWREANARSQIAEAVILLDSGKLAEARQIALGVIKDYSSSSAAGTARDLIARIKSRKAADKRRARQRIDSVLGGGLRRAADAFESGDFGRAFDLYAELDERFAKDKALRARVHEAVRIRVSTLQREASDELALYSSSKLPEIESLTAPDERKRTLAELTGRFPDERIAKIEKLVAEIEVRPALVATLA